MERRGRRVQRRGWSQEKEATRNLISRVLGIGTREANRLIRVLDMPDEVQMAYDDGKLSLQLAGAVAGLTRSEQEQIAASIRAGGKPVGFVRESIRCWLGSINFSTNDRGEKDDLRLQ